MNDFTIEVRDSKTRHYLICDNAGKDIAHVSAYQYDDGNVYLFRLYVDKSYRKQGMANALVDKLLADFPNNHVFLEIQPFEPIEVTPEEMKRAEDFYKAKGFIKDGDYWWHEGKEQGE